MELVSSYLNSFEGKLTLIGVALQAIIFFAIADNQIRSKIALKQNGKKSKKNKTIKR